MRFHRGDCPKLPIHICDDNTPVARLFDAYARDGSGEVHHLGRGIRARAVGGKLEVTFAGTGMTGVVRSIDVFYGGRFAASTNDYEQLGVLTPTATLTAVLTIDSMGGHGE